MRQKRLTDRSKSNPCAIGGRGGGGGNFGSRGGGGYGGENFASLTVMRM